MAVAVSFVSAGGRTQYTKKILPPVELESKYTLPEAVPPQSYSPSLNPAQGDTIGKSDYDYGWNSATRTQVVPYLPGFTNGTRAQLTFMERFSTWTGNGARRTQRYVYYDGTGYISAPSVSRDVAATGFGDISVWRSTAADGIAAVASHTVTRLAVNAAPGDTNFVASIVPYPRPANGGPGDPVTDIQGTTDNLFLFTTGGNRDDIWAFKTSDFGTNWVFLDSLKRHIPGATAWGIGLDVPVQVTPAGMLYVFDAPTGTGAVPPLGTSGTADADRLGYYRSTNGGVNWTWTTVAVDGQSVLASKPFEYYLFENFGQLDGCVDQNGTVHMVVNGYGFDYARPDSAEIFRILYWNSQSNTWKFLDRDTLNRPPYVTAAQRSGNGIGRPYPTITYDPTRSWLMAAWSEPQGTATLVDTANGVYMYDIWASTSRDGGATWTPAVNITNTPNASELFVSTSRQMTTAGATTTQARAHITYLYETRANNGGNVIAGQGPLAASPYIYRWFDFGATSVGDAGAVPAEYALEQNYPNPFNPSTVLSYTLPVSGRVSLKVFNVLGEEVASLVNEEKAAGSHKVNFNGANLASGVYFYTLRAGEFTTTRKMLLTK
jgi:hypothetical protein